MIKFGIIFKKVDIIKFLIQDYFMFFKVTTPVLVLFAILMHVFLNHIIVVSTLI